MIGDAEGIFSNVQNTMGNAFNQITTTEFNSTLELYNGSNRGGQLKSLLDEVIKNNKTKDRKITVKYEETETLDTDVIKDLKTSIKDSSNYEVSFEYDEEGFIYEVNFERVFSDFEKKRFNGSFEMYAGSKMGSLVISALDNIITSNKTEERIITVKYLDTETQKEEEIKNIKRNIDRFGDYELSFEYDVDGFITKATIEKIS